MRKAWSIRWARWATVLLIDLVILKKSVGPIMEEELARRLTLLERVGNQVVGVIVFINLGKCVEGA
jgi:hypothetical protein